MHHSTHRAKRSSTKSVSHDHFISPLGYAWKGATRLATMDEFASEFKNRLVTRAEYLESGSALCESRFRSGV
jgi:actin-related protein